MPSQPSQPSHDDSDSSDVHLPLSRGGAPGEPRVASSPYSSIPTSGKPMPPPVAGNQKLLDDIDALFQRYVEFTDDALRHAVVLWAAHTHVYEEFDTTPRLLVVSPTPECGKTTVLNLVNYSALKGRACQARPSDTRALSCQSQLHPGLLGLLSARRPRMGRSPMVAV
ncbi:MAG: hypothetical protein ACYCR4_05820 [Acidimicrobiales bacterium]